MPANCRAVLCCLTSEIGFAYMTQQLMKITPVPGKVVLALEGG